MPFSDPFADGPVNQQGAERAIAGGTTLRGALDTVSEFRQNDQQTPVVLMGYLNPVIAVGKLFLWSMRRIWSGWTTDC